MIASISHRVMYYGTVKKRNASSAEYIFFFLSNEERESMRSLPRTFVPRSHCRAQFWRFSGVLRQSISLWRRARKIGSVVESRPREKSNSLSPPTTFNEYTSPRHARRSVCPIFFVLFHSSSCTINGYMQITSSCCIMLIAYACIGSQQVYSEWSYFVSCICIYANSVGST